MRECSVVRDSQKESTVEGFRKYSAVAARVSHCFKVRGSFYDLRVMFALISLDYTVYSSIPVLGVLRGGDNMEHESLKKVLMEEFE